MTSRFTTKTFFITLLFLSLAHTKISAQENNPLFDKIMNKETQNNEVNSKINSIGKSDEKTNEDKPQSPKLSWNKSLMFDKEKIRWVKSAIKSRESGVSLQAILPDLFPAKKIEKVEIAETDNGDNLVEGISEDFTFQQEAKKYNTIPDIYLGSVLYFSPNSWAVWINGEKITDKKTHKDFKIVNIQRDKVTLEIKDIKSSGIDFKEKKKYRTNNDNLFVSSDKKVTFDKTENSILVSLNTYQSFIASDLEVVEGNNISSISEIQETIGDILNPLQNIIN